MAPVEVPVSKPVDVDPGTLSDAETEEITGSITFGEQKESKVEELTAATGSEEQVRVRANLLNNLDMLMKDKGFCLGEAQKPTELSINHRKIYAIRPSVASIGKSKRL